MGMWLKQLYLGKMMEHPNQSLRADGTPCKWNEFDFSQRGVRCCWGRRRTAWLASSKILEWSEHILVHQLTITITYSRIFPNIFAFIFPLPRGAATCSQGFVVIFLKVPLACWGSNVAAVQPNSLGNSQKTFYKISQNKWPPHLVDHLKKWSRVTCLNLWLVLVWIKVLYWKWTSYDSVLRQVRVLNQRASWWVELFPNMCAFYIRSRSFKKAVKGDLS